MLKEFAVKPNYPETFGNTVQSILIRSDIPTRKKSTGVRSGDLGGHATETSPSNSVNETYFCCAV